MWSVESRLRLSGAAAGSEYYIYKDPNGKIYPSKKKAVQAGYIEAQTGPPLPPLDQSPQPPGVVEAAASAENLKACATCRLTF